MSSRNRNAKKKKGTAEAGEVGYTSVRNNDAEKKEKKEKKGKKIKKRREGRGGHGEDTSREKNVQKCYVRGVRLVATSLGGIPCQNRQRGIQWREARGHG